MSTAYINTDNTLWCQPKDAAGSIDAGATLTATVYNEMGSAIESGLSMNWVASRSRFEVTPDETLWNKRRRYYAVIDITGSAGEADAVTVRWTARARISST